MHVCMCTIQTMVLVVYSRLLYTTKCIPSMKLTGMEEYSQFHISEYNTYMYLHVCIRN